jgi:hypothetical protein
MNANERTTRIAWIVDSEGTGSVRSGFGSPRTTRRLVRLWRASLHLELFLPS